MKLCVRAIYSANVFNADYSFISMGALYLCHFILKHGFLPDQLSLSYSMMLMAELP